MVSALKHKGKRLYQLARKGLEVRRALSSEDCKLDLISFLCRKFNFIGMLERNLCGRLPRTLAVLQVA